MFGGLLNCPFAPRVVSRLSDAPHLSARTRFVGSKQPGTCPVLYKFSGLPVNRANSSPEILTLSRKMKRTAHCLALVADARQPLWDAVGLGQAMVDVSAYLGDESLLADAGVAKGARKIITIEERAQLLSALDGNAYQVSAGGSLANTMMALARLGLAEQQHLGGAALKVGMLSVSGDDVQGSFHCSQLRQAGVQLLSTPLSGTSTGTVIVLTTSDANRTFLSYLGGSQSLTLSPDVEAAVASTRVLIVEGYLWEMPGGHEAIRHAVSIARANGAIVAATTGDAGVVSRHRDDFWALLEDGSVDVVLANRAEAGALLGKTVTAAEAAAELGSLCSLAAVTDGANGSCLSALGRLQMVAPFWMTETPVDTCGAGDAYTAGLLFAYLRGMDIGTMGRMSSRVASAVICRSGACLSMQEAEDVVASMPTVRSMRDHFAVTGHGQTSAVTCQQ